MVDPSSPLKTAATAVAVAGGGESSEEKTEESRRVENGITALDIDKDTGVDNAPPSVDPSSPPETPAAAAFGGGEGESSEEKVLPLTTEGKGSVGNGTTAKIMGKPSPVAYLTPAWRPSRDRKSVERYSNTIISTPKFHAPKTPSIHEGSGSKLKDIPNVLYKISKRKPDQNLQALHALLYQKKSNVLYVKRNILQFSGFDWTQDAEEKLKAKLNEKLLKLNRDILTDFCKLLDIPVSNTTKKEEICSKLIVFLECPSVTRDVLLVEKEKRGKPQKKRRASKKASKSGTKKQRSSKTEPQRKKSSSALVEEAWEEEKEEKGDDDGSDDERVTSSGEHDSKKGSGNCKSDERNALEEPVTNKTESRSNDIDTSIKPGKYQQRSGKKGRSVSKNKTKTIGRTPVSSSKRKRIDEGSDSIFPEALKSKKSRKSKNRDDMSQAVEKGNTKDASMLSIKEQGKGNSLPDPIKQPSREQLCSVVSDILKEADFDKITLADVVKQLGAHFKTDVMSRKQEVKSIIEEVMSSMYEEDEADDDLNQTITQLRMTAAAK